MSIPYPNVAKAIALRSLQLAGGINQGAREVAYQGALSLNMEGLEVPYSALKRDILAQEKEIVQQLAFDTNSLYKAHLYGKSANLSSGDLIPTVTNGAVPFIGSFHAVRDASNDEELTEAPLRQIRRRNTNAGTFWRLEQYHYALTGSRIAHTRTSAYVEGVAWDEATQASLFDSNGNSPLPAEFEALWIAKVLSALPQENWFVQEASYYRQLVNDKQGLIINGKELLMDLPQLPEKGDNPVEK